MGGSRRGNTFPTNHSASASLKPNCTRCSVFYNDDRPAAVLRAQPDSTAEVSLVPRPTSLTQQPLTKIPTRSLGLVFPAFSSLSKVSPRHSPVTPWSPRTHNSIAFVGVDAKAAMSQVALGSHSWPYESRIVRFRETRWKPDTGQEEKKAGLGVGFLGCSLVVHELTARAWISRG